jgi:hypothetical protein
MRMKKVTCTSSIANGWSVTVSMYGVKMGGIVPIVVSDCASFVNVPI